jgi:hypothetical protein
MTQPEPQPQLVGGAQVIPGPDGKHHVALVLQCGPQQTTLVLPPDTAGAFVDQLAHSVRQAAQDARRLNVGLILPTPQLPTSLAAGNGHHPAVRHTGA